MQVIHTLLTDYIPWVFIPALFLSLSLYTMLVANLKKYPNPSLPRQLFLFALTILATTSPIVRYSADCSNNS